MDPGILRARGSGTDSLDAASDWQRLAVRRLAWIGGLGAVIGLLGGLLGALLRQPNLGVRAGTERPLIMAPLWAAASLAVYLLSRSERISASRRLDVGLVFLVVSCFFAGLYRHWLPYVESDVVRGFSPVALTILFFAVVVPVSPVKMGVAATLAALVDGLALALTATLLDNPTPPWNLWVWLLMPNAFVVVVAVMTSRFLYRLAETVRRAEEMGAYRLVEKLGAGGMGEVWRAEHRSLARPAAIKLIRPELLGVADAARAQEMLTRFEREAKATAALTSPHTIGVYDFGRAEDGAFYYVMELLEGMDLESLVKRHGALPQARAVHLLRQVVDSLRDAHESGVVHRDIKPANIMVCRQGSQRDFVKVLDFGLVKIDDPDDDDEERAKITEAGMALGTPAYMAPEIAHGGEASPQSDLYALGCLAYWLLAGRLVFADKPHPMQQILAHVSETPERLDEVVTGLDPRLADLVAKCLEKEPGDRPESMADVERVLLETRLEEGWTPADASAWWRLPPEASAVDPAHAPTMMSPLSAEAGDTEVDDPALLATAPYGPEFR